MRTKIKRMVEQEVTICKCDFCDYETDHNRGCCGSSPVMQCSFCGKDGCREHRKSYWENEWEDYPDFTACADCIETVDFCEYVARQIAGRYDIWRDTVKKIYDNLEEYNCYRDDFKESKEIDRKWKIRQAMRKQNEEEDLYL